MDTYQYSCYIPILRGPTRLDLRDAANVLYQIHRKTGASSSRTCSWPYLSFKCKGVAINWRINLATTNIVIRANDSYTITGTRRFWIPRTLVFDTGETLTLRPGEYYEFTINYHSGHQIGRISSIAIGTPIKNPPQ